MSLAERVRERAECVERDAVYPHERHYAAGLRHAADLMEQPPFSATDLVTAAARCKNHEMRSGIRKALAMLEDRPEWSTSLWMERVDLTLETLATKVEALAIMVRSRDVVRIPRQNQRPMDDEL